MSAPARRELQVQRRAHGGFEFPRGGGNVRLREDRTHDGDADNAAAGKPGDIVLRDAADGDDRDGHGRADVAQGVIAHGVGVGLCPGREHGAHAEIVRALALGQQRLAADVHYYCYSYFPVAGAHYPAAAGALR